MGTKWRATGGLLVALALAGVACGGGGAGSGVASLGDSKESPSARKTSEKDFEEASLAFATCMREEGVDVDTSPDGGVGIAIKIEDVDRDMARKAEAKCRHHLEGVEPPQGAPRISPEERRKQVQNLLRFARCMREQGIDFPDPKEEGGMLAFGPDEDVDVGDPDFRAAEEECRKAVPSVFGPGSPGERVEGS